MNFNLSNKLALITGGASGIGLTTADLFASQGADLALVDLSPNTNDVAENLQSKYPNRRISAHVYDITKSENIEKLFDEIKAQHPTYYCPTILVNSAGIGRGKRLVDLSETEYDSMININLKGTFLVTQALIKRLVSNFDNVKFTSDTESYASIIMLSSISRYGAAGSSHYAMTKAGVDAFSNSIAKEYGAQRIRCNSVLPFVIDTPMARDVMNDELRKALLAKTALNRFGKPEEVAQLIYFLATDASSYITGASIDINGGAR